MNEQVYMWHQMKFRAMPQPHPRSPNTELHCFSEEAPEGRGVLRLPVLFCGSRPPAETAQRLSGSSFRPSHNSGEPCACVRPCFDRFPPAWCGVWNVRHQSRGVKKADFDPDCWTKARRTNCCVLALWGGYSRREQNKERKTERKKEMLFVSRWKQKYRSWTWRSERTAAFMTTRRKISHTEKGVAQGQHY